MDNLFEKYIDASNAYDTYQVWGMAKAILKKIAWFHRSKERYRLNRVKLSS